MWPLEPLLLEMGVGVGGGSWPGRPPPRHSFLVFHLRQSTGSATGVDGQTPTPALPSLPQDCVNFTLA
ncbi:hypothetical protein E2C01_062108 [Portunus trituberculatus]|uniref:Uncharacterized protein n=1 Tax=Portunus trituberculatus TaxID=210409 RepID=A0A5B7HA33_PORTR|nr:hypothetical protein [Portunus trituberculatus]